MRCPRCGFTTFEFEACPQCEAGLESGQGTDISAAAKGGFWVRLAAFLIDNIFILIAVVFLSRVAGIAAGMGGAEEDDPLVAQFGFLIGIFFVPFYFTLFTGWDGRTLGKWLFGLRVIRVTGEQVGYGRAFVRYLGYIVSLLFFGLGFIMIAVDRNKRGLHDLIAGTCVIRVRD